MLDQTVVQAWWDLWTSLPPPRKCHPPPKGNVTPCDLSPPPMLPPSARRWMLAAKYLGLWGKISSFQVELCGMYASLFCLIRSTCNFITIWSMSDETKILFHPFESDANKLLLLLFVCLCDHMIVTARPRDRLPGRGKMCQFLSRVKHWNLKPTCELLHLCRSRRDHFFCFYPVLTPRNWSGRDLLCRIYM